MVVENKSKMKSAISKAREATAAAATVFTKLPAVFKTVTEIAKIFGKEQETKAKTTKATTAYASSSSSSTYTSLLSFSRTASFNHFSHNSSPLPTTTTITTELMSALITFQCIIVGIIHKVSAIPGCWPLLLLLPVMLLQQAIPAHAGSCREAQLCCNGRDSSCVVQKAPINAIIEDLNDKPCYCDHACLKLGDCCTDFKDHCGVLDCQVGDWGQWSECNASCGAGVMTRSRKVLQPAQNGGKHCPTLLQKRGCQGFRCHGHHHDKKILRETALLLPAGLSHRRHAKNGSSNNNTQPHAHHDNSNSNQQKHQHQQQQQQHDEEYCVEFEVLRSSKACHKLPPYNLLIEGDRIVVRCDMEAYIPDFMTMDEMNSTAHNLNGPSTKHHNNNPSYKQKYEIPNTSAIMDEDETDMDAESDENMIEDSSSSSSNSEEEEHDEYDTASLTQKSAAATSSSTNPSTIKTTTTTTTTTTTISPYPPLQIRQFHCRGEGLPGRTTRWTALAAPSCRGKWLRLTLDTPKKCTHPQFAFV
ncbi:somatomedin B and thrombospondin type 1 domain containing protein vexed [Musca autumnalis]|uniref:somatomedin B and thrombospondin type 1 domain containing protein vexed n=1 Tax=Musca autumnalis TaxID=221902 RepID=UPI003CF528D6